MWSKKTEEAPGSLNSTCGTTLVEGKIRFCLVYDRDGYAFGAVTGRKADDLFSWYTRQYTQEETEREKEADLFIRIRTEDGDIEVHRQDGGNGQINPPFSEDCSTGWTQWWFLDANGARRCLAMDRQHEPVQSELIDQEQGGYRMDERVRGVSPANNFNTNQLNAFSPHMCGCKANRLEEARSFCSAGNNVARAGDRWLKHQW